LTRTTDPLVDAITVLENILIENPSARMDTEDAMNRVTTALGYLRMTKYDRDSHGQKAACQAHLLDGHTWTCTACLVAEADRRDAAMRRVA